MSWRLAKSLTNLRKQVNAEYPKRSKDRDGTIGDAAHAATASDHNPNPSGVVCALDLTHDPKNGFDAHALAEHLRVHRHPNLRYIISNARIAGWWNGWTWEASSGHTQHIHVSVGNHGVADGQTTSNYDSTKDWNITKEEIMEKTAYKYLIKGVLNRSVTKEDEKKHLGKDPNDVILELVKWSEKHNRSYGQTVGQLNAEIKQLRTEIAALKKQLATKPAEYVEVTDKLYKKK